MGHRTWLAVWGIAGVLLVGCSGSGGDDGADGDCLTGAEGCACAADGTCDAGLVCADGRCLAWATGTGGAGTGGGSGTGGGALTGGGPGTGGALTGGGPGTGGTGSGGGPGTGGGAGTGGSIALPPRVATLLEAECAIGPTEGDCDGSVTAGAVGSVEPGEGGGVVGYFGAGDALHFDGLDLSDVESVRVRFAKGAAGGTLELRTGGVSGALLATYAPPVTGGWSEFAVVDLVVNPAAGVTDLYLVASGAAGVADIDWLELVSGSDPMIRGVASTACGAAELTPTGADVVLHVSRVGYDVAAPKQAVVELRSGDATTFQIVDAGNQVVACGDLVESARFEDWGDERWLTADFGELTAPGSYRLLVAGEHSATFAVARGVLFDETVEDVLGYFSGSRASDVDVLAADTSVPVYGSAEERDVRGGWYDASADISKYLSHLNYGNFTSPQQIPLVAWALAKVADDSPELLQGKGLLDAFRAEARWGADYLVRVQDEAGFFYTNVFDGWTGELDSRTLCAFEGQGGTLTSDYEAAFREGGGLAIAALARVGAWGVAGDFPAATYLEAAEDGYAHLLVHGASYCDDGQENVIDDYAALLAAVELYAATSDTAYLDDARSRADALAARLHPDGYFVADDDSRPFWHASDAGLPVVALSRYLEVETDATRQEAAKSTIRVHLTYLLAVTGAAPNPFGYARQHYRSSQAMIRGFFIPHDNETGYWWQGENARLGSLAAAALIGGRKVFAADSGPLGVPPELAAFAQNQLDWILGENPYDVTFLHGYGQTNPPHYTGEKPQHTLLAGGIANGITGQNTDGTGLSYNPPFGEGQEWMNWRWVEQWLPHSTWYLLAITAMAED